MNVYVSAWLRAWKCVSLFVRMYVYACVRMHARMCSCVRMCACGCAVVRVRLRARDRVLMHVILASIIVYMYVIANLKHTLIKATI